MRIVISRTPMHAEILKAFPQAAGVGVVFAWGDAIYNPSGIPLGSDLIAHEEVHAGQQRQLGIVPWWKRYIADPKFRLEQEIPAYRRQYEVFAGIHRDRNVRLRKLAQLATDMSSPLYAMGLSHDQAIALIWKDQRNGHKGHF